MADEITILSEIRDQVEAELWAAAPSALPEDGGLIQVAASLLADARQLAQHFSRKGGTKYRGRPRQGRGVYLDLRRRFMRSAAGLGIDKRTARRLLGPVEPHQPGPKTSKRKR